MVAHLQGAVFDSTDSLVYDGQGTVRQAMLYLDR